VPAGTSRASAATRAVLAAAGGLVVGAALAAFQVAWQAAVLVGWDTTALVFIVWIWATIGGLNNRQTRAAAVRVDPSAAVADTAIVSAGVACLAAVAFVLIKAGSSHGGAKALYIAAGVASVAVSWTAVHTIFTLRYARIFYSGSPGGIDFNEDDTPNYVDFAYTAFTIGMTFQVSDTDLTTKPMRATALRHALLSFLFGAVMVGLTINVVASLLK
jgi:uncharacterized membrane protein